AARAPPAHPQRSALRRLASGAGRLLRGGAAATGGLAWLPEDLSRLVADFACESITDLLSVALVDRACQSAARLRLSLELRCLGAGIPGGLPGLLSPQTAQQFVALPEVRLGGPPGRCRGPPDTAAFAPFAGEEALLHCRDCSMPLLKVNDIVSASYRIMRAKATGQQKWSPGDRLGDAMVWHKNMKLVGGNCEIFNGERVYVGVSMAAGAIEHVN
ncbi:unnamed protein product, partial [Prorocentrum cordatum]